jgi:glycosyltransferase involved in cell wall biosynthesis
MLLADAIKNPETSLDAYRGLPGEVRERTSLIFFSRREPEPGIVRAARSGECTLIMRPDKEQLAVLYNLADLFLFPSWYEGFGLPVLEAMACGTPVVGSGVGAVPELIEDSGLFVADPNDHQGFSRAAALLLTNTAHRHELRARALQRAATFSWRRAARETQETYIDAINVARARPLRDTRMEPARN